MKIRRKFAYLWLLLPVILITIHFQWGIENLKKEKALLISREAVDLEKKARDTWDPEDWNNAQEAYNKAIEHLPESSLQSRAELELAAARSCLYKGQLVEAMDSLKHLLNRAESEDIDPKLKDEIRETLARSQYGLAWIMRKKHVNRTVWNDIAESSRQNFRYLAENASNPLKREAYMKDLEASVRLENSGKRISAKPEKQTPKEAINSEGEKVPVEATNSEGEGVPMEAANSEGEKVPMEAANSEGEKVPMEAANSEGEKVPMEAANSEGEKVPMEAANSEGEGVPMEAANSEGEGAPMEAANAEGEGMPMEAMNAEGNVEEMMAQMMAEGEGEGPPVISDTPPPEDSRETFSQGAGGGEPPGSGS